MPVHRQLCKDSANLAVLPAATNPVLGGLVGGCVDHKLAGGGVVGGLQMPNMIE